MKNKITAPLTTYERYRAIQIIGTSTEIPFSVRRFFGTPSATMDIACDGISLGEDYGSLSEVRLATEFFVTQLGGKVVWSKV
jgi:hypothetical protein